MNDGTSLSIQPARLAGGTRRPGARKAWWGKAVIALALLLSAFLIYRLVTNYDLSELVQSVRSVPLSSLLAALGWAAASYLCLTFNDWLAVRYAGHPLPYRLTAMTSFVALAFGHNIGFAALSSGAIRLRFYARAGLRLAEVAKVIVFCGITIFLGLFIVGVTALLARPDLAERVIGLSPFETRGIAMALMLVPIVYIAASVALRKPIRIFRRTFEMPSPRLVLGQMLVGTINFVLVAGCLDATISAVSNVPYFEVLSAFVLANTATILTHSPGGLGVIETVVLEVLKQPELIGAVLLFRFVYFLVPLALGATLFAIVELRWRLGSAEQVSTPRFQST
jgi:uncharacterized membrane protein YbhN (UPF0104 family)